MYGNSDTLFCVETGIAVANEHILSNLEKDENKNKKIITRRENSRNLFSSSVWTDIQTLRNVFAKEINVED